MSEAKGGLQFVSTPASGWCDPETGVCHFDPTDEATTADDSDQNAAGHAPDATQR